MLLNSVEEVLGRQDSMVTYEAVDLRPKGHKGDQVYHPKHPQKESAGNVIRRRLHIPSVPDPIDDREVPAADRLTPSVDCGATNPTVVLEDDQREIGWPGVERFRNLSVHARKACLHLRVSSKPKVTIRQYGGSL